VRIWQTMGSADPIVLSGHTDTVWGVAFSPDGRHLASASFDRTVRIWQTMGSADPIVLSGHTGTVWGVAFSPDGRHLASSGNDGIWTWTCEVCGSTEELLALVEQRVTRELTCGERRTFLYGPPCP
jgi:WD40 repeat protein